jgi:hypothetical protein
MTFKIASEFTDVPGPRYRHEGPNSGQEFRESVLLRFFERAEPVVIDLDDVEGYGSSFLEEAFGGLVREHKINRDTIFKIITFKSEDDPGYIDQIRRYIEDAVPGEKSVRNGGKGKQIA